MACLLTRKLLHSFYHLVFEEEIGRVKGHFGPINTVAFHPDGTGYASGAEDGFIRVHHFDDDYFNFKYAEEEMVEKEGAVKPAA